MLTYLKISGGFGIFASAASDKIEAHPNTFRHHHQMLSREQVEIGAAIGAGAAGAIAGLGLGAMGSSPGGGEDFLSENDCLSSSFVPIINAWKSSGSTLCPDGCAVQLDRFVDNTVDANASLVFFTADPNTEKGKVLWKYGNAACSPPLSGNIAEHTFTFITNVNFATGESVNCKFFADAYVGKILGGGEYVDDDVGNPNCAGFPFFPFCARYVGKQLVYAGPGEMITVNAGDDPDNQFVCPR